MRLARAVLFVALTGTWALADEAKPADPKPEVTKKKVPYRVVKTLPETGQVLLFDKDHASHVVAELGQTIDGYLVEDIDEDEVTLIAENGAQIILTAPPPPPAPRTAKRPARPAPRPVDPYADAQEFGLDGPDGEVTVATKDATGREVSARAPAGPEDPYAEPEAPRAPGEGGVRVASAAGAEGATAVPVPTASASRRAATAPPAAPIVDVDAPELADPYGDPGIAAFAEAVGAAPAAEPAPTAAAPAKPAKAKPAARSISAGSPDAAAASPGSPDAASALAAAATGSPAPEPATPAVATVHARASATGTTTIARAELDAALANFSKLAASFRATFTPDGLRLDAIHDGTLLTRVGLRKGDTITYIDGQPLRSLDDAANLYARASTVKNTTIQVARDGKLVTLRVAIR